MVRECSAHTTGKSSKSDQMVLPPITTPSTLTPGDGRLADARTIQGPLEAAQRAQREEEIPVDAVLAGVGLVVDAAGGDEAQHAQRGEHERLHRPRPAAGSP